MLLLLGGCAAAASADETPSLDSDVVDEGEGGPITEGFVLRQNTRWTIDRRRPETARIVAYGDSIFAGYQGSIFNVARRSAPYVAGEYLAKTWDVNVEVVRRTRSGALAEEVADTVVSESSFVTPATRAVYIELCGNDYLEARRAFADANGRCDEGLLDRAVATCVANTDRALAKLAQVGPNALRVLATLYYPGYDANNVPSRCRDATSGAPVNVREKLLPRMVRSNWQACTLARRHGAACVDAFAELMGGDDDANADGVPDVDGLRFDPAESEADYVARILRLRATIHDANRHPLATGALADYIQSDDVHPTFVLGTVGGNSSGRRAPDFADGLVVDGKNPRWNLAGHERFGWALSRASIAAPPSEPAPAQ